jgi:hypothetical protein
MSKRYRAQRRQRRDFPRRVNSADKYGRAFEITDQKDADKFLERCVRHCMRFGRTRDEATVIERANIGYFGGYVGRTEQLRAYKLFNTEHPIFGLSQPEPELAFKAGAVIGEAMKDGFDITNRKAVRALLAANNLQFEYAAKD